MGAAHRPNSAKAAIATLALLTMLQAEAAVRAQDQYATDDAAYVQEGFGAGYPGLPQYGQPSFDPYGYPSAGWDGACGPMFECMDNHQRGYGPVGGFSVYYLRPRWTSNPALGEVTIQEIAGPPTITLQTQRQYDFEPDYNLAGSVWAGWLGEQGFGGRGRWFWFEDDYSLSLPVSPTGPTVGRAVFSANPAGLNLLALTDDTTTGSIEASSSLRMDVIDAEALARFYEGRWMVLLSGGMRYARIRQRYGASFRVTEIGLTPDTQVGSLDSSHTFEGLGPTLAAETRYGETFAVFGIARGSLLVGDHDMASTRVISTFDAGGVLTDQIVSDSQMRSLQAIPVAELDVGVEWSPQIGWGRLSLQAAVVGQVWFGLGNAAGNDAIITTTSVAGVSNVDYGSNMTLAGLRASANWFY